MNHLDKCIYTSKAWNILSDAFKQKKTSSTYLLYGKEGIGRWLHAVAFTALLNCESVIEENSLFKPCGSCSNCVHIFNLNFDSFKIVLPIPPHENKLDKAIDYTLEAVQLKKKEPYTLLTSAKTTNIPISLAREIKKKLALRHDKGQIRVVLFYKMEQMRKNSADALLKMIEEPPSDTVIILIADKPDSLLPTIQSRSQKIKIPMVSAEHIKEYLLDNFDITDYQASLLSKISEGSIGQALVYLESIGKDENNRRSVYFLIFKSLFNESGAGILAYMNDLLNLRDRSEILAMLRLWQMLIRDSANFAVMQDENEICNIDFDSEIKELASFFKSSELSLKMAEAIKITLADLERNVHIQGALMALGLKLKAHIHAMQN